MYILCRMDEVSLKNQIEKLQKTYYEENGKNVIFKNTQKKQCAEYLTGQMDVSILLDKTVFIVPNKNCVFLDYTVFKLYAHEPMYETIVKHILTVISNCIDQYGCFETHINLKSFTISAAQRYVNVIKLFCNLCLQSNTRYASLINKMVIYNTPSMIDVISKMFRPFINDRVRERIELVNLETSTDKLAQLFALG